MVALLLKKIYICSLTSVSRTLLHILLYWIYTRRMSCSRWLINIYYMHVEGLPERLSSKKFACQCRRCSFHPWFRKIPWRRERQPTPSVLDWKNPINRRAWWATVHRLQRVRHNLVAEKQPQIFMKKECYHLIVLWLSMMWWRFLRTVKKGFY